MHKKKIIVLISVILFILISITILFLYKGSNSNGDYERAKKETLSFLDENKGSSPLLWLGIYLYLRICMILI